MRPALVGLAVEPQIRPQGRPDEACTLNLDHAGIEEVDPDFHAFVGEPRPRVVDFRAVELVVPEDVEDVRGSSPELRELRHKSLRVGREIAGEDDDAGLGVVLGHPPTMLKVEIGEDLDLHRCQRRWGSFSRTQLSCSPSRMTCSEGCARWTGLFIAMTETPGNNQEPELAILVLVARQAGRMAVPWASALDEV